MFLALRPFARKERVSLVVGSVCTLLVVATNVAQPWPIKVVIDQVILGQRWTLLPDALSGTENATRLLFVCIAAVVGLAVLRGLFGYLQGVLLAGSGQRIVARLQQALHDRLLRLSLAYHSRQRSGDLLMRLSGDTSMVRQLLVDGLFSVGEEILLVVAVLGVLSYFDVRIAALAAIVVPAVLLLLLFFGKRLRQAARKQRKKEGEIGAAMSESLQAVAVIQAYGLEEHARSRFAKRSKKGLKAGLTSTRIEGKLGALTELALALGTAGTLLVGVHEVRSGNMSAGTLLVLSSYVRSLYRPLRQAVMRSTKLFKATACGERVLEVLDEPLDVVTPKDPTSRPPAEGRLRFEGVSFGYASGHSVLEDVTFEVRPGEKVALLGPNGAGKSTLCSLVPRLRDAQRGRVLVEGVDVRQHELTDLRRRIAIVFQDAVLFDGTLEHNVRLGREDASDAEVRAAAERAGLLRADAGLPQGLSTEVGERGTALSGGQRQRVALARALLRDAAILIFDEPTTALDHATRARFVKEALRALDGKTMLVVTHDLEIARELDRVVRLENGVIVEDRTRAELEAIMRRTVESGGPG